MFLRNILYQSIRSQVRISVPKAFISQNQARNRKSSGVQQNSFHPEKENQRIAAIEKELKAFNEFKEGSLFQEQGKYSTAHELLKRVLDILEMSHLKGSDPHLHLLRILAKNQFLGKNYATAEKYLKAISDSVSSSKDQNQKYKHYEDLLQFYLKTNIEKTIEVGKSLLSDKNNLPLTYQQTFLFNLGTAYLLNDKHSEAISTLNECVELEPDNLLKGFALNNIALATWWQKSSTNETAINHEEVISLFKDSIYNIENVSGPGRENKELLEELLNNENIAPKDAAKLDPDTQVLLTRKEANVPLLNIAKYLFNNLPEKKNEGTFWAKYAIKSFEKNDPDNVYRILMTLAQFYADSKQFIKAEGLFRRSLELLENKNSYDKVTCLEEYGNMLTKITNRKSEGEKVILDANKLQENFPVWTKKMSFVCLPDSDLESK